MREIVYTNEDREEAICDDDNFGVMVAIGEKYWPAYGSRWYFITDDDIEQLKAGKMFYATDGEYAYCLVYKGGKK